MTRTMLRDALSALAAATLVSAAPGGAALAQGKSVKAFHAEVAMDAVRGHKLKSLENPQQQAAGSVPRRTPNGQDWRWFEDYGGRHSQPSVQKELSLSDDQ